MDRPMAVFFCIIFALSLIIRGDWSTPIQKDTNIIPGKYLKDNFSIKNGILSSINLKIAPFRVEFPYDNLKDNIRDLGNEYDQENMNEVIEAQIIFNQCTVFFDGDLVIGNANVIFYDYVGGSELDSTDFFGGSVFGDWRVISNALFPLGANLVGEFEDKKFSNNESSGMCGDWNNSSVTRDLIGTDLWLNSYPNVASPIIRN
jgi:hypothetical protein